MNYNKWSVVTHLWNDFVPTEEQWLKLKLASQALDDFRAGQDVSVCCPECGERLVVTCIDAIGSEWVQCPTSSKHLVVHFVSSKPPQ